MAVATQLETEQKIQELLGNEELTFNEEELQKGYNSFYNKVVKRVIDVTVACVFAIVLLPFYIIIGLCIAVESGLPVFYRADRGGYKGKPFKINKFRSMVKNADKIGGGTTVSSLLSGLNEGSYCKVYKGNTVVSSNTAVGTGMVVKIMDGNTVKASYTVIVTGDTNGDGNTTITDMVAIKSHVLGKTSLTGVYATAADTSGDNSISLTDFIQVKAKILGKSTITAR